MLKLDGQLNALILPSEDSEEFSWDAFDGLPVAVALDGQSPSSDSVNVRWGRSGLELLEKGEDTDVYKRQPYICFPRIGPPRSGSSAKSPLAGAASTTQLSIWLPAGWALEVWVTAAWAATTAN